MGDVEDGVFVGHAEQPNEVVDHLGKAERRERAAARVDVTPDWIGGGLALEHRDDGERVEEGHFSFRASQTASTTPAPASTTATSAAALQQPPASTAATTGTCAAQVTSWYHVSGQREIASFVYDTAVIAASLAQDRTAKPLAEIQVIGQGMEMVARMGSSALGIDVPMPVCGDPANAWMTAMASYQLGGHDTRVDPSHLAPALAAMKVGATSLKIAQGEIAGYTPLDCRPIQYSTASSCVS